MPFQGREGTPVPLNNNQFHIRVPGGDGRKAHSLGDRRVEVESVRVV
jgi:hypothetical protein